MVGVMNTATNYIVVPAPGHYGDRTVVLSSHRTLAAAKRNAGRGYVVRESSMVKGNTFLRCYEATARVVG